MRNRKGLEGGDRSIGGYGNDRNYKRGLRMTYVWGRHKDGDIGYCSKAER